MDKYLDYKLDLSPDSRWNMVSATPSSKLSLLYLQESGDFIAGPGYFTTRRGFESFLIKLTVSGSGILSYRGSTYKVSSGQFYWIDCEQQHDYRTDPEVGEWHVLWVHFYGPSARYYYETFLNSNENGPVGELPHGSDVKAIMYSLLDISTSPSNQQEMDITAACLLSQLVTQCILSSVHHTGDEIIPDYIIQARMYLEEHYREKVTLEQLGAVSSTNPFYLQKQFKRYTGQSPTEYLIYLRMTNAKKLMRTTHLSIGEIASEVGIDNHNYFTRQFKSVEGLTPQEYRRLWPIINEQSSEAPQSLIFN